jgi:hypothetical protein
MSRLICISRPSHSRAAMESYKRMGTGKRFKLPGL